MAKNIHLPAALLGRWLLLGPPFTFRPALFFVAQIQQSRWVESEGDIRGWVHYDHKGMNMVSNNTLVGVMFK